MPSEAEWVRFDLEVPAAAIEAAAAVLRDLGAGGVVIEDPHSPPAGLYDFDGRTGTGPTVVGAYFPVPEAGAVREALGGRLRSLEEFFGPVRLRESLAAEADWVDRWREHYHPFRVGGLWIAPPWEPPPTPGNTLVLDPGPAFGTGLHPTTRLCLGYLSREVRDGSRVLDLGTGSGILGLAALKWGAATVTAFDIDPAAVRVATANAERNGLSERFFPLVGDIDAAQGLYDVAVANIIAEVVRSSLPGLARALRPGGILLASGLLAAGGAEWPEELAAQGFSYLGSHRLGSWLAFRARRADG